MSSHDGYRPESRRGRMNRSRLIAAGTSVGALVAITAGVAAANPAPAAPRTAPRVNRSAADGSTPSPSPSPTSGSDDWQQLPPDPSESDNGGGTNSNVPPAFDPGGAGNGFGGSDTRSGGS